MIYEGVPDKNGRRESIRFCERLQLPLDKKLELREGSSRILVTAHNANFGERGITSGIFKYWSPPSGRKLIRNLRAFRIRYDNHKMMLQDGDNRFFSFSFSDVKEFYLTALSSSIINDILGNNCLNGIQTPYCIDVVIIKDDIPAHFQFFISKELCPHWVAAMPESEYKRNALLNFIL